MTHRTALTAGILTIQLAFTLACFGGTGFQSPAGVGSGGDLDDAPPPTTDEAPGLRNDGRCDWLGTPFATQGTERVFLLRFSDVDRDCDESPEAERKLLYVVDAEDARPLMDVSAFENVRMMDGSQSTLLFAQNTETASSTRVFDLHNGDLQLIRQDTIQGSFESIRPSASRRWMSGRTDGGGAIRVLDSETLTTTVIGYADAAQHAWSKSGDTLVTVLHTGGVAEVSIWDFNGADLPPESPTATLLVAGWRDVSSPETLTLSADGQFAAFSLTSDGIQDPKAALIDLDAQVVHRIPEMRGNPAFTGSGQLIGVHDEGFRVVDLETLDHLDIDIERAEPAVAVLQGAPLLLAGSLYEEGVGFVNPETGEATPIPFDDLEFGSWTADGSQVFMAQDRRVLRADLITGDVQVIDVPPFRNLLWLPNTGRLYADGTASPTVRLVDPTGIEAPIRFDLSGPVSL